MNGLLTMKIVEHAKQCKQKTISIRHRNNVILTTFSDFVESQFVNLPEDWATKTAELISKTISNTTIVSLCRNTLFIRRKIGLIDLTI
jgi:hypothetical protein